METLDIPFLHPIMPSFERWQQHVNKAYETGWFSNNGPLVQQFEKDLQEYLQTDRQIVVVSNATVGLQLALKALEIKRLVLVPSFTFSATVSAIRWCGLLYKYVDIDDTYCMDPLLAKHALQQGEVDAIMPVHALGNPCNVIEFEKLGEKYGAKVIFDAAAAIGATHGNRRIGNYGDIEVFSLHATKCLPVGEGGFLSIKDPEVAQRVRKLKNFGFDSNRAVELDGTNAKMPELMAAIGIEALKDLPQHMRNRQRYVKKYKELLEDVVEFQPVLPDAEHGYQILNVMVKGDATPVIEKMIRGGVQVRKYFVPLHLQPVYQQQVPLPKTMCIAQRIISLPLYSFMEVHTIETVCRVLRSAL